MATEPRSAAPTSRFQTPIERAIGVLRDNIEQAKVTPAADPNAGRVVLRMMLNEAEALLKAVDASYAKDGFPL